VSGLRLLALGVGDAFSTRYYSSCAAVEAQGQWLLLDCPHPLRKILYEAAQPRGLPLDLDRLSAVALTHLHGDHSSGLEGVGFYARFLLGRRMPLVAHPDVLAHVWDGHLAGSMALSFRPEGGPPDHHRLEDYFEVRPLAEGGSVEVGPFRIECRPSVHSIPATAFRVTAGGRCLGYSGDTAFDAGLIDWLASADLIVHETNPGYMHTPYEALARLPADLRARLRLIHYPDHFDLAASAIEPLRQGQLYEV
jgi:ribonuclease BN (tRNA processing enzyme)